MMDHRTLHEMIDACRPGSADIHLPEVSPLAVQIAVDPGLRDRFQRSQQLDARIARSMEDIAVPAGLHERILARVATEEGAEERGQGSGARGEGAGTGDLERGAGESADGPSSTSDSARVPASASRRRWYFSLAVIAAGLLALVTGYKVWPRHTPLTYDSLLNRSSQWYEKLQANPAWQPLGPRDEIRDFPLAEAIRARPRHWADVSNIVGQAACAYDLASPDGQRATLFVIPDEDRVAGSTPPLRPGSSTEGVMIGCWQSGGWIYVLVVEGNEGTYRNMLDGASRPLAEVRLRFRPLAAVLAIGVEAKKCA
jgi:hypothetical protein